MNHRHFIAICLALAMLCHAEGVIAVPFPMPKLPEHEIRKTKIHYEGKKLDIATAYLSQKLLYLEAPNLLESDSHWVGKGPERHLVFVMVEHQNNKNIATNTFTFEASNSLILKEVEKVVTSPTGVRLRREYYLLSHPANKSPEDMMHPYTLELAFRALNLEKPGSTHHFSLWLPPAIIIPMEVKVRRKETIETPLGLRQCYKVELKPQMSAFLGPILGRLIQPLIPSYEFWFDVHGTHPIMRYKGPLGKVNIIGVPDEVYDIISIDPDPSEQQ